MSNKPYRLIRGLCFAGVLLMAFSRTGSADERTAPEYKVKAAFLFHFAEYAEWPPDALPRADSPLVIGVIGRGDPFNGDIEAIVHDKRIGGHPIVVAHYANAAALGSCHVLFVCEDEWPELDQIIQKAGNATLTVADAEGFTDRGGLVRFFPENGKVHFEVNLDGLRHSRLKISSKLLKLAKIVHE